MYQVRIYLHGWAQSHPKIDKEVSETVVITYGEHTL